VSPGLVYTIGHSTRSIDDFIQVLARYGIEALADIRTIPRSKHNPQFDSEALSKSLALCGIEYLHLKNLGGLRKPLKDSPNGAWKNASFRGYADYMQTKEFEQGVEDLIGFSNTKKICIMCAEAVSWRCHRSLVGDALTARGIKVIDIFDLEHSKEHTITSFAKIHGKSVTYPDIS
jgi:uncharacterized protein (DUF488 family)